MSLDYCEWGTERHTEATVCQEGKAGELTVPGLVAADTGYFDVDTATVLTRCWKTLAPREDYVAEVLSGVPDLYGEELCSRSPLLRSRLRPQVHSGFLPPSSSPSS